MPCQSRYLQAWWMALNEKEKKNISLSKYTVYLTLTGTGVLFHTPTAGCATLRVTGLLFPLPG